MPIVSIIIPVYNVAEYLPRCIDSVLSQTFIDFELLLIDDGSSDQSGRICDDYAQKDNRIRVFHKENGGAGAARKFGVQHAKGEWIEFVDGDDTIPCDSLYQLYDIAKSKEYEIVIGTLNLNNKACFKHKISGKIISEDYIRALLLNETSIGPVAKLFNSSLFNSLEWNTPKEIKNNEDLLMLLSLATKANNVYVADKVLAYNYLYREGSASKSKSMSLDYWILLFAYIESVLRNFLLKDSISQALLVYEIRMLYCCNVLQGDFVDPNSSILTKLQKQIKSANLDCNDRKLWLILQSSIRQRVAYYQFLVKITIKGYIKKILGRK